MGFLSWLTKSGIRLAAVAGAVKISIDQNVWTLEPAVGETVYDNFTKNIVNGTVVYKEKLPSCEEVQSEVGSKWNKNVNCAFHYINNAPELIRVKSVEFYRSQIEPRL
ncbi:unnamed protein product [Bursaphelenchus okinawaensis]|uniref:MICOS complex subunit MIC13 n=1 Tax=Bursaphelenchus okinawaensis TaxID=465554 RepID=A0A811JTH0_9BILA|nr:unnamed protein product [Bursaphelenchus okinawaensis]CAG9082185.1 unnamed protein product [Bursaphelenchus okinawaensis]